MTPVLAIEWILSFGLIGAGLFRLYGAKESERHGIPKAVVAMLFTLPYAFISPAEIGLFIWIVTFVAMVTGHGNGQDLGTYTGPTKDEKIEFLVKWLKPYLSPYWYDAAFLAVNGLLMTAPGGIAAGSCEVTFSGLMRPVGYMIGRWSTKYQSRISATAMGEILTGFFFFVALAYYAHHRFFRFW